MKTGILGCGNAGLALYALMVKSPDFEPVLFSSPDHIRTLNRLLSSQGPILFRYDSNEAPVSIERDSFPVIHSLENLLSDCNIIINTLPVEAHIGVFNEIYRIIITKNHWISYINLVGGFAVFDHFLTQEHQKIASIASAHTLPIATRVSEGYINILNRRKDTPITVSDSEITPAIKALEHLMGTPFTFDDNFLHSAIDRSSSVMHPLITMLNITRIERGEKYYFFEDGWTDSVERLLLKTYHERRALCEELGFFDFITPEKRIQKFKEYYWEDFKKVYGPDSVENRYFTEDIPYGSVFMCTLGQILGVPMPLTESLVNFTSVICDKDFWNSPLNLLKNEALAKEVLSYRVLSKA
ncbi:MAG: NAD/NADP octopine/nopaline dehydrogenase family protein [Bacteroidetes bacterium]|nr:NAD/NADP octopine/nopaline dehydrogenase family protein [Bacteroidota bacterium]